MRALVLSGGGAKGAAQIGVLKELLDNDPNLDYDVYAGISVGALNSSFLCTGKLSETFPKLESIWLNKIKGNHSIWTHNLWHYILIGISIIVFFVAAAFISFIMGSPKWLTTLFIILSAASFYLPYYSLNHTHSVYKTEPLRKLVDEDLDEVKVITSGKFLRIGAVSFETGLYEFATETNKDIKDWIMASSAFPVFFPMVEIDGQHYTDGGIRDIAPLKHVLELGVTEIDIILASPIESNYEGDIPGVPGQLMRFLDIMSSEIVSNDLETHCNIDGVKIRIFVPEKSLTDNSLNFDPKSIRYMYEEGRKIAANMLAK